MLLVSVKYYSLRWLRYHILEAVNLAIPRVGHNFHYKISRNCQFKLSTSHKLEFEDD